MDKKNLQANFYRIQISFITVFLLIRFFEYFSKAIKIFFVEHVLLSEFTGFIYDLWFCFIYSAFAFILFIIFHFIHEKLGNILLHILNSLIIAIYISLIIVYSERSTPFDHELFTRNFVDSFSVIKSFAFSGLTVYLPFLIFIPAYFFIYHFLFKKLQIKNYVISILSGLIILSCAFFKFAMPSKSYFKNNLSYYLTCNKLTYFTVDSFYYFLYSEKDNNSQDKDVIEKEIEFFQQNRPFTFTSKEYPLMHKNDAHDVLGSFFNFKKDPPNIVILVIEGLSRDFSGNPASPVSFTPFLDSLSNQSLCWTNFLSCAQGTFGVFPAVLGSLPYGEKGFSLINNLPDHLSLIKILRQNGYYTEFMAGCDVDFDNLSTFLRFQGTDFILSSFGKKYKKQFDKSQGWSMGYPDDALFDRSLEMLDSINKKPYLNVYLTVSTHAPYAFSQSEQYEKLFQKKMKSLVLPNKTKQALIQCGKLMRAVMFVDDRLRKFFNDYKKRSEYSNTIFIITGDHHHGFFPSRNDIDDFHVPMMIYSPLLKAPQKFLSVNSHNNITPTLVAMLNKNFQFKYDPSEVHWMNDVMDTCKTFRNTHQMAFMLTGREIIHYLYKNYYITRDGLYKILPNLEDEACENDSLTKYITRLRDNFKFINSYVCRNNKIFPPNQYKTDEAKELLFETSDEKEKNVIAQTEESVSILDDFKIPSDFRYLDVIFSGDILVKQDDEERFPRLQFALSDNKHLPSTTLWSSDKNITTLTNNQYKNRKWNSISVHDKIRISDFSKVKDMFFNTALYNDYKTTTVKVKNLCIKIYGIR